MLQLCLKKNQNLRQEHCTVLLCYQTASVSVLCSYFAKCSLDSRSVLGFLFDCILHAHIIEFTRLKNKRPFRFMISLVESLVSLQFSYGFRMGSMCVCGSVLVRCFSVPNSVNSVCMDHVAILVCPHGNEFDGIVFEIEMNVFM